MEFYSNQIEFSWGKQEARSTSMAAATLEDVDRSSEEEDKVKEELWKER